MNRSREWADKIAERMRFKVRGIGFTQLDDVYRYEAVHFMRDGVMYELAVRRLPPREQPHVEKGTR